MTNAELAETFEANQLDYVKKLARAHTADAIRVLARIMKSTAKTTPVPSKIAAAKAILEYGYGRPGSQYQPRAASEAGGPGVVVNILKVASGEQERVEVDITPAESAARVLSADASRVPTQPDPGPTSEA